MKNTIIFLLGVLFILITSLNAEGAKDKCKHDAKTFRCVQYLYNYDGDTITFNIPNVHALIGQKISIRVQGIDTPEKRTDDPCEKKLAEYAKKELGAMLMKAKTITLTNIKKGKYFRIVSDVRADGVLVSDMLIRKGLAYPYFGKTKPKTDWCKMKYKPTK